jgi:exopolysaccharide biosynthesis polyprenyl glycosylphosphotransferase
MKHNTDTKGKLFLAAGDVLIVYVSLVLACLIRFGREARFPLSLHRPVLLLALVIYPFLFYVFDLYEGIGGERVRFLIHYIWALGAVVAVIVAFSFIFPYSIGRGLFLLSFAIVAVLCLALRGAYAGIRKTAFPPRRTLIVGPGRAVDRVIESLWPHPSFEMVGVVNDGAPGEGPAVLEWLGRPEDLEEIISRAGVSDIIVADDAALDPAVSRTLVALRLAGIRIFDAASFYEHFFMKLPVRIIRDEWFVKAPGFERLAGRTYHRIRRTVDVVIAALALIVFLPLFAVIAVLDKLSGPGPVFYIQERLGYMRRPFRLIKFRTMVPEAERDGPQWAGENDRRVTRMGRCLRRTRLDELPQLINVLKGDMSLIGPRPEREFFVSQLSKDIPYYGLRFFVKPGITGWAQIRYRYGSDEKDALEKLRYELYYIKNQSLGLDIRIMLGTLRAMISGAGT